MTATSTRRSWPRWLAGAVVVVAVLVTLVAWLNLRGETAFEGTAPVAGSPAQVERGEYLARAGNCMGCHTAPGGGPFAGGKGVQTPFGTVYAPNITPDVAAGIGLWTPADFWRALHHGRSKSGRLLYPAFPYPSYTHISRDDSDALYAFLRTVQPAPLANQPHALRFPYNTQAALAVWRALFFRPGEFANEPGKTAEWNRGKYLVQALGHCAACHSSRNVLGGTSVNAEFAGGLMPDESWYAPSLASPHEAGLQAWSRDEVVKLLKTGVATHAAVSGPMADVVYSSTQHLSESDLGAMAQFLADLPVQAQDKPEVEAATSAVMQRGGKVYGTHCAACHGDRGQGVSGIYPALAGNRAVTLASSANVVQVIRLGGFSPSTAGNPQPFGMPPYAPLLDKDDIAAVATFVRQSWGNQASAVAPWEVQRAP